MKNKYILDKEILIGIKKKDEEALNCCIDKYGSYVSYIVSNILGKCCSNADCEETIADVFITIWEKIDQIDINRAEEFKSYLGAVARNKSKNKIRQLSKGNEIVGLEESMIMLGESVEDKITAEEIHKYMIDCIKQLSVEDRKCFIKYYYYQMSIKNIAKDLGLNESTVKSKLARGRDKLKKMIIKEGGFNDDIDL